jgi:hypothetical protein
VLQQDAGQWKLAGMVAKPEAVGGHDGLWYWTQARQAKAQGHNHVAWFYLITAQQLLQPVDFISTTNLDKLFSEEQAVQPQDVPVDKPVTFTAANGQTWQILQMFTTADDKNNLVLVVKYSVPDVSNTGAAFNNNTTLANQLVQKYPEYRNAFASIVTRATAPNGQDFGTEVKMSDIK